MYKIYIMYKIYFLASTDSEPAVVGIKATSTDSLVDLKKAADV